ncbi:MAG TPA: hypothetical protein VLT47_11260 [Anaeromyxobacteraceae bacterium]|nr:hypothetical protein [Anaeromyxobacteraceae bacterium]
MAYDVSPAAWEERMRRVRADQAAFDAGLRRQARAIRRRELLAAFADSARAIAWPIARFWLWLWGVTWLFERLLRAVLAGSAG